MELFDENIFDPELFDASPAIVVSVVQRGTPINAYKQFKFIDRNGNTYYLRKN